MLKTTSARSRFYVGFMHVEICTNMCGYVIFSFIRSLKKFSQKISLETSLMPRFILKMKRFACAKFAWPIRINLALWEYSRVSEACDLSMWILIAKKAQQANLTVAWPQPLREYWCNIIQSSGTQVLQHRFRAVKLATTIVRLFARCRAICIHAYFERMPLEMLCKIHFALFFLI